MYLFLCQPEAALEQFAIGRRLSPRDPLTFVADTFEGLANHMLRNYVEAVELALKAIRKNPDFVYPHFSLARPAPSLAISGKPRRR